MHPFGTDFGISGLYFFENDIGEALHKNNNQLHERIEGIIKFRRGDVIWPLRCAI